MVIIGETAVLALVCLADLLWTMWVVANGSAVESNPIMQFYLQNGGLVGFAAAKVLLFAGPIFALEVLRHRRPRMIRTMLRACIVLYVVAYTVGVVHVNAPAMAASRSAAAQQSP